MQIALTSRLSVKLGQRAFVFLGIFILLIYLSPISFLPIIFKLDGKFDWDQVEQRFGAIQQTLVYFGQWTGNNPWIAGGTPLINSQFAPYGLFGGLSILFGPYVGLRLALIAYYLVGYAGCWKLAGHFKLSPFQQLFFTLYVLFGNALAWHLYAGHIIFLNILVLPALLYLLLNFASRWYAGFTFGLLLALAFCDGPLYTFQYMLLVLGVVFIWQVWTRVIDIRRMSLWIVQAFVGFGLLAIYRFVTLLPVMFDFPRKAVGGFHVKFFEIFKFSSWPYLSYREVLSDSITCNGIHEQANYLGIVAILLVLLLVWRTRKSIYLVPFVFLLAAYSGDTYPFQFQYLLKLIPTFDSHLCTTRLRLLSPLIMGAVLIYAVRVGDIRPFKFRAFEIKPSYLLVLILVDIFLASFTVFVSSHERVTTISGSSPVTFQRERPFVNYSRLPIELKEGQISEVKVALKFNIGVLRSGDSHLTPATRKALGIGDPSYQGEFLQNGVPITPVYWSPNRIVFATRDITHCISTNVHVGKPWMINGVSQFSHRKLVDFGETMCVMPDSAGNLELTYAGIGHEVGVRLTLWFLALFIAGLIATFFLSRSMKYQRPTS